MSKASNKKLDTKTLTMLALLAALAYVVMFLSKQIPVNVLGFLNFDLKDVIVCITGFLFGPLAAFGVSLVVSFIEMITISSPGPWGLLMNVLSTCALACTAAWFYRRKRTIKNAIIGLVIGVLLMTAVMLLWNYLITHPDLQAHRQRPAEGEADPPLHRLRSGRQEEDRRPHRGRRPAGHLHPSGPCAGKSDLTIEGKGSSAACGRALPV